MKKLVTTGLQGSLWLVLALSLSFQVTVTGTLSSQGCIMTCPPNSPPVQVSVSSACSDVLSYQNVGVTLTGCTGQVIVDIMENGISLGDIITTAMVGNTYMVVISIPSENQSCMTFIEVVDKQAPILNCPQDVTLACTANLQLYNGLLPGDISDCAPTTVSIIDVLLSSGNCEDNIMSEYGRMYIVVDAYNNADTCEQLISLEKADLEDVDFPPDLIGINALNCFPLPDTSPVNTGYPSVDGNPIVNGNFCNLLTTRVDFIVPLCSGSYKILRTWRVYDWCEGSVFIDSIQIIEISDPTGPLVVAPADITVSTGASDCFADVQIPPAAITEDCSASWTVRIQGPFGTMQGNGGLIQDLPVGIHTITFIATNACNLEGQDVMTVTVQDLIPPTPVCHQHLVIPLNNIGNALIPASAFNAGSTDNCNNVFFKVRRMNAPLGYACSNPGNPNNLFDDQILFCCEDIVNNNIMVVLRVYDLPPGPGPVASTFLQGHYNDCMVEVEIQDKLPPSITCPEDITVSCIFPITEENLGVFGTVVTSPQDQQQICIDDPGNPGLQCYGLDGLAQDNCSVEISTSAIIDVNMCGTGTVVRTFIATDDGGRQSTCQQVITIVNFDLFDESDITWPLDFTTNNICEISLLDPEDLSPPYNAPVLNDGTCDLTAATYEDEVFDFSNNDQACFKILRTWTVIDWCQLNTKSGGTWTHTQIIKVMNTLAPIIEPIDDIVECSFDPACGGLTLTFVASAEDDCSGPASLSWRYFIDIDNNQSYEVTSPVLTGSEISFTRDFPIGSHRIVYTVWDQCGNSSIEEQDVTVESCTAPSAKCLHGLSTNLMSMDLDGDGTPDWGMVTLQAEMFDAGSDHSCGNDITLAFSSDPLDVSKVFDCSDLGVNEIELWVIDENGLTDFCITEVVIQDNNEICPEELGGSGTISGNLTVPNSGKLSGAMVHLDGSNLPAIQSGSNGYFVFPTMPYGGQYNVRPTNDGNAKNGVTTLDLVKIQKHLLGIETFTSPFQSIAADVNNSKTITAIDIVVLRKLILGYFDSFPENSSWRFVDAAHIFPDPANPWVSVWPEQYIIDPFGESMNEVNFNAVKVGDLNLSANLLNGNQILHARSSDQCDIEYWVSEQKENDVYKVEMILKKAPQYRAIQFSFDWNKLGFEVVDWMPGPHLTRDDIRIPENEKEKASLMAYTSDAWEEEETVLLTMWVRELPGNMIPFAFYLSAQPTEPLAYVQENDEARRVVFTKKSSEVTAVFNRPNPFKSMTTIVFDSKLDEKALLHIYDMNGREILRRPLELQMGQNEWIILTSELHGVGMYLYEITSTHQYSTNRMIIVE